MASAQLDLLRARTVALITERIMDAARRDCPGHHFNCALLHQCQQQSLQDKFNIYFASARHTILQNPGVLVSEEEGKDGKIDFITNFLTCATPSSIYFGQFFSPCHDKPKTAKRKRAKKDVLTKLFEEVTKE